MSAERQMGRIGVPSGPSGYGPWMQPAARLASFAQANHGVFSLDDVDRSGVSRGRLRTLVEQGWCERVSKGVYRIAGAPVTWEQGLAAAIAAHAAGAVVSHQAACRLWAIVGYRDAGRVIAVPTPSNRRSHLARVRTSVTLPASHVTRRAGLPVTTVARTLFDLAGVDTKGRVERAVDAALSSRLTDLRKLQQVHFVLASPGRRGTTAFRSILDDRCGGVAVPASELERVGRQVFAEGGLPTPDFEVDLGGDEWIGRVDCLWRDVKVVVELDGRTYHEAKTARDRDRRRDNRLMAQGWRVLRFTWDDLNDRPGEVVALIRAALAGR